MPKRKRNMPNKRTTKKYIYGKRVAEVADAQGVRGVILGGFFSHPLIFRVYHKDGEFTDYELRHDDLEVAISKDALASFYKIGRRLILDHSPEVLGLGRAREGKSRVRKIG